MHRVGGLIADADGEPLKDVWVMLPKAGISTSTDAEGRFLFDRLAPGSHELRARTADGRDTTATLEVPGAMLDLVLGDGKAAAGGKKTGKRG
jgi:hypothetical protein